MAGKGDAEITVGADASAVERAAAVAKAAWRDVGQSLTSSIGSAARAVIGDLANVATATGKISFSSQHAQVREFEASTAHLAVATGRDLESVRSEYEATGKAIGKRPAEIAAWATEVGKLTGNFRGAGDAIKGLSGLAAETNRSVDDYRGLAVELGTVGHVAGDTTHAVGVLAAQADALGTVGGVAAFTGQVEALGDTISHFAGKSEADFLRVTAVIGVLGKGLGDAASKRVQSGALGALSSDPLRWERYLGHQVTDEHGQINDPVKVLQEITDKTKRRFGKDARRVLQLNFGAETGAAMYNADFSEAAHAAGLAPSKKPAEAQQAMNATDAGKRDVSQAELAASSRALLGSSTALGSAADKLQQFAAHNPITSTFLSGVFSTALGGFMTNFGASIAKMMGGKGYGGAVGGAIELATKGTGAGSAALKAIPVVGAAVAGFEVGAAAGQALVDYQDEHYDKPREAKEKAQRDSDMVRQKEIRDRVRAAKGLSTFAGGYVPEAEDSQLARKAAAGSAGDLNALIAKLQKEGESKADAERIGRAVVEAIQKSKPKVEIVNSTGGPIEVVGAQSSSAAAGSQSH
jgi:hypothetical protein